MSEVNEQNESVLQYVEDRQGWLVEAADVITGEQHSNPDVVFLPPTDVRNDAEPLKLSLDQETKLREIAGRFGIGGEVDVPAVADYEIIEGGKVWKVSAEATIAQGKRIYAGSPHRKLGQDELDHLAKILPEESELPVTEYDMARQTIERTEGFVAHETEKVISVGYDINDGHKLVGEPTGQLIELGLIDNYPVYLLRVDRENYYDEEDQKHKYRNQPDSAALVTFVGRYLGQIGDNESSVGLLTSNTYASRAVDIVRAGLSNGRDFRVGMYGRQTLAKEQRKEVAEPTAIHQIPGELHTIGQKLKLLESTLKSQD